MIKPSCPFTSRYIICRYLRRPDRKSTRLNSSHGYISYAVFCLKKKTKRSHGVLVFMEPFTRRILGVTVHARTVYCPALFQMCYLALREVRSAHATMHVPAPYVV